MRTGVKNFFVFVIMFLISAISAFASDNSLLGIDIKYTAQNGYNVTLKTDKTAKINKLKDESGNIILTLKETLPSQDIEIIYDNPEDITNVIVQKKNTNTIVLLEGKNIENAKIYTKDLSTGVVKPIEAKSSFLFVADKKLIAISLFSMVLIFLISLLNRPKKQKYAKADAKELKSKINANTLRKKNLIQSKNIPSINYKVNSRISVPKDFVISQNIYEEEKIRKAG